MEKLIVVQDKSIYYTVSGAGKPVMLVHGFGEDSRIWETLTPELEKDYLLIIPDLPGSGKSEQLPETSMESMAEVLKLILDDLRISSCIMIGHSMGGYVALAFAATYASMLDGLGLFHSTAYADDDEKIATRRKGIQFIQQHGAAKFQEQTIPNLFSDTFKSQHPGIVREIIARFTNFTPQSLVSYYEAMIQRPDRSQVIKSFTKPVLFIAGEYDKAVPMEHSLRLGQLPGLSYIHILKHSGHMGMLEEPEKSLQFLRQFLQHDKIT